MTNEGKPTLVRHRLLDSLGSEKRRRVVNATEKLLRSFGQLEPAIPEVTVEEKDDKTKVSMFFYTCHVSLQLRSVMVFQVAYLNRALKEDAKNFSGEKPDVDKDVEEVFVSFPSAVDQRSCRMLDYAGAGVDGAALRR